jgi:hypothetical protein
VTCLTAVRGGVNLDVEIKLQVGSAGWAEATRWGSCCPRVSRPKYQIRLDVVLSSNHGPLLSRALDHVDTHGRLAAHLTPLPEGQPHHRVSTVSTQPLDEGSGLWIAGLTIPGTLLATHTLCLLHLVGSGNPLYVHYTV